MNLTEGEGFCTAHLQWPAVYTPTNEPILVNGTLLSLGDDEVSHNNAEIAPELALMDTKTVKLQQYRDQFDGDWNQFIAGPVKSLVQAHLPLQKCKDLSCNGRCQRFHPAVEEETEVVLLDVWAWRWADVNGKPTQQRSADLFTVYIRIPQTALTSIIAESGWNGYYVEPRAEAGLGTDQSYAVVWLPKMNWDDIMAIKRKHDICVGLARIGTKLGLRVLKADEPKLLRITFPGRPIVACEVNQTFEVGPLPPGTSKAHMIALLQAWKWEARPLKPSRSTTSGRYWEVGTSSDPPAMFLHTEHGPITVTQKRQAKAPQNDAHKIFASSRTMQHIKKAAHSTAPSSSTSSSDPWLNSDPWQAYKSTQSIQTKSMSLPPSTPAATDATKKRIEEMETRIKGEMQKELENKLTSMQQAQASNDVSMEPTHQVMQLQADVKELQAQNSKFEGWFQDVHHQLQRVDAAMVTQEQTIQGLSHQQAQSHQQLEHSFSEKLEQQTSRLEALFEKRFKSA